MEEKLKEREEQLKMEYGTKLDTVIGQLNEAKDNYNREQLKNSEVQSRLN